MTLLDRCLFCAMMLDANSIDAGFGTKLKLQQGNTASLADSPMASGTADSSQILHSYSNQDGGKC